MKNRGLKAKIKNFEYTTINKKLKGIYYYLAMPKNSSIQSQESANTFIKSFCKYECNFEGSLSKSAKIVQMNWEYFKEAVEENK